MGQAIETPVRGDTGTGGEPDGPQDDDRGASPPPAVDPLDALSGTFIEVTVEGEKTLKELTFRELEAYCQKGMKLMDSLTMRDRYTVQRANDRNWKPLSPYEGIRRGRRRY